MAGVNDLDGVPPVGNYKQKKMITREREYCLREKTRNVLMRTKPLKSTASLCPEGLVRIVLNEGGSMHQNI